MKTLSSLLFSALLLISTASAQTGPYNRKASQILFAPTATGGVSASFVGELLAPNGIATGEDASTTAELYVNGSLQMSWSWTILMDGGTNSCSLDCGSDCGALYVDGVFNDMTCHETDSDCQCGHWLKWDTGYEPNAGDEIMVILRPAPGALPDADPSDDQHMEIFTGKSVGWNRRLDYVEMSDNGDGTSDVRVHGHLTVSNIGSSGKLGGILNLGFEVAVVDAFETEMVALSLTGSVAPSGDSGCDQGCSGQPCGVFAGNNFVWPTGLCGPWLGWTGCSCGSPFDITFPNVPVVPFDEIMVILRPAPGALPELPGFPEEDDQRRPPRDGATAVDAARMAALQLESFPNPFNPATTIHFDLPSAGPVQLSIYDVRGQLVRTLIDDEFPAGESSVRWNGIDERGQSVSSGSYYAQLNASGRMEVLRLSLLK